MGRDRYLFRQLAWLATAIALPLLALLGYNLWLGVQQARAHAYQTVQGYAAAMARDADALLASTDQYLRYLSRQPLIAALDPRRCDPVLRGTVQRRTHFANVLVLDESGAPVCLAVDGPGTAPATFAPFIGPPASPDQAVSALSKPFFAPIAQRHVVAMSHPIAADGARRGTLAVLLDLESLHRGWAGFALPPGSRLSLVDTDGTIVSTQPDLAKWIGRDVGAVVTKALADNPDGSGVAQGIDGVRRAFAAAALGQAKWRAFAALPEAEVLAGSSAELRRNLLIGGVAVGVAGMMAVLIARRLARPLTALASTARAVAAGDAEVRADTAVPGEFSTVAQSFNAMLDAMQASQARLRESERRLADLFIHIGLLSIMLDRDARIIQVNDHMLSVTGWTRQELLGSLATDRLLIDGAGAALGAFQRMMGEGQLRRPVVENRIRTRDGGARWVRWHSSLLRSSEGEVVGMASLGEDITAMREAEQRERRQLDFYTALSRTNGAIVRHTDPQSLYDEICRICVEHGHASIAYISLVAGTHARPTAWAGPAPTFLGDSPLPLDPDTAGGRSMTAVAIRSGQRCVVNDVYADPGTAPFRGRGRLIGTRAVAAFPFRRAGAVTGALTLHMTETDFFDQRVLELMDEVSIDLSFALDHIDRVAHLQRTQQELRLREQQVAGLVETAMDAFITIDASHRILLFNQAASAMFGVPAAEVIGQPIERFVPQRVHESHREHVRHFAATGSTARRMGALHTLVGVRANGEEFPIEASISKLGDGDAVWMTVVIRDATELRRAEQAKLAQVAAESANHAKSEFLSRMSHELRTPLNAVLGFSQLLQADDAGLGARQREQVAHIGQAGWHLLALINDVMDVSRIEAGRMRVEASGVDVIATLDEAVRLCEPAAAPLPVQIDAKYRALPQQLVVRADPVRLRQVLVNVLSNAVKYNRPNGRVALSLRREAGEVCIEVADTGLGMTDEQMQHLYEPFNRLGRESVGIEGTGLGLALTRQLVWLMNGRIEVASEVDVGTCVTVCLPLGEGPAAVAADAARSPAAAALDDEPAGTVLYIEDNPVNMLLVEQLLARWPRVLLVQATDGQAGLTAAARSQPDVTLLDMLLPDMDGVDVLRRLRAAHDTRALRVVALSASAMPQDMQTALDAGADDYWTKPLDFEHFEREMRRLLHPAPA